MVDDNVLKSIAFPFRRGANSFPEMSYGENAIADSLRALVTTNVNERVMRDGLGINDGVYIFENLSEIDKARLAADVKHVIETYEKRVRITGIGVETSRETAEIMVRIFYQYAGKNMKLSIAIGVL